MIHSDLANIPLNTEDAQVEVVKMTEELKQLLCAASLKVAKVLIAETKNPGEALMVLEITKDAIEKMCDISGFGMAKVSVPKQTN